MQIGRAEKKTDRKKIGPGGAAHTKKQGPVELKNGKKK